MTDSSPSETDRGTQEPGDAWEEFSAESSSTPLRERKRAALHATIQRAALDLAVLHGYEHVTVDMICEASMTSPRTFFNYFGSKEGAFLGSVPTMPAQPVIDRFVQEDGQNVFSDVVMLVTDTLADQEVDRNLYLARLALFEKEPELALKRVALIGALEDQYVEVILARFRTEGREGTDADLENEARMIVALTQGVMGYARRKFTSPDFTGTVQELLAEAVRVAQRVASNGAGTTTRGGQA